jgi:hypothetical protein
MSPRSGFKQSLLYVLAWIAHCETIEYDAIVKRAAVRSIGL